VLTTENDVVVIDTPKDENLTIADEIRLMKAAIRFIINQTMSSDETKKIKRLYPSIFD